MTGRAHSLPLLLCLLAWGALAVALGVQRVLRLRSGAASARRSFRSLLGLLIQSLAFYLVFAFSRAQPARGTSWEDTQRWAGAALAWAGTGLVIASMRALGRHWSLEARLLPGHRLVREGPYARVRHPIYLAMLGPLVGTGLNLAAWPALGAAMALYLVGTWLRVTAEDRLLRDEFGADFARYADEVRALWPVRRRRPAPGVRGGAG